MAEETKPKAILGDEKPIVVQISKAQALTLLERELPETITATFKINPAKGNLVAYSVNGVPTGRLPESKYSSQWKNSVARTAAALMFILSDSRAANPRLASKATSRNNVESESLIMTDEEMEAFLNL